MTVEEKSIPLDSVNKISNNPHNGSPFGSRVKNLFTKSRCTFFLFKIEVFLNELKMLTNLQQTYR